MEKTVKNTKNKRKFNDHSPFKKFLIVTGISFSAFFVIAATAFVLLFVVDNAASRGLSIALGLEASGGEGSFMGGLGELLSVGTALPERTNVLLIGSDEPSGRGYLGRADMLMIVTIHAETGQVSLVSVPRDAHVTMPQYRLDILRENGRNTAPSSGSMRINEITHHAGPEFGPTFMARQVEELMGIEIHYYVHIDLEAFRFIINQIGGIDFYVPRRMFYHDPYQDLLIDLQPGQQTLMGHAAEGLVRYRSSFANQDLGRVQVQQDFMREAMRQIMDMENILGNPMAYLSMFLNHLNTNFSLLDVPPYLTLLPNLDLANVEAHTLSGRGASVGGRFVYIMDEEAIAELVEQVFYAQPEIPDDDEDALSDVAATSFGLDIEVLNGTNITGLAARTSENLTEYGYNIVSIGDYFGNSEAATRILVRQAGRGQDLTEFFRNSRIVIDPNIDTDIVIILGTDTF
ncbi:MAG: LCP family protein [Defluviitaleaceae bacterium]|nr:LCP family protein [Defluviitaleaceae bacterium]